MTSDLGPLDVSTEPTGPLSTTRVGYLADRATLTVEVTGALSWARQKAPFASILAAVGRHRFVQWGTSSEGAITVEAVSDTYLAPDARLSEHERRRLTELEFVDGPEQNWQRSFGAEVDTSIVAAAIVAALEAFGLTERVAVEHRSFPG